MVMMTGGRSHAAQEGQEDHDQEEGKSKGGRWKVEVFNA
jgi:hypothetical protein